MNARDEILGAIRARLSAGDPARAEAVRARLRDHPLGCVPAGPQDPAGRLALFVEKARAAAATVATVAPGGEAAAIAGFLREHNLPSELRMGADPRLESIDWPESGPRRSQGPARADDLVSLSHAAAGIAESGTLVLLSGPDNPTTLNFLPENHIVLLDAADIATDHETVWASIRERFGPGRMPRTLNMITGPSRSADIEQTLILGAHGPVRLHIVVVVP